MRQGLPTLALCGDVMLGRGVDQILPGPGDPTLWERLVRDARGYVDLAERANGPIPRPVPYAWPWGDVLDVLDDADPDVRVVNLETSVTRSDDVDLGKAVNYRMAPENLPALAAARPDVCALANNHVLDFGRRGLIDTLDALAEAGLPHTGAGRNAATAWRPVRTPTRHGGVLVLGVGSPSSGVPDDWAARGPDASGGADGSVGVRAAGVAYVPDLTRDWADRVADTLLRDRAPGDTAVVSIHWGSNWGYAIPSDQVAFAHRLIDRGVDVVHGHSSHHPRPIEVYRGRLILYGCGDLINDYEGIGTAAAYRDDLRLVYLATLADDGALVQLRMVPVQARRMTLHRASPADARWLADRFGEAGDRFGTRPEVDGDGVLVLRPDGGHRPHAPAANV